MPISARQQSTQSRAPDGMPTTDDNSVPTATYARARLTSVAKSSFYRSPIHYSHGARSCFPAVDTRLLLLLRLGATAFLVGHLVFFLFDSVLSITRYSDWALFVATVTFLFSVAASLLDVIREEDDNDMDVEPDTEDPLDCESQLDSNDGEQEQFDHDGDTIPYHAGAIGENSNSSSDPLKRSRKPSKPQQVGIFRRLSNEVDAQSVREENQKFPLATMTASILARMHQVSLPMCIYSAIIYWTFLRPSLPAASTSSLSYPEMVINTASPLLIVLNALFSRTAPMRLLIGFPPYLAIHVVFGLVYFIVLRSSSIQAPYPYVDKEIVANTAWTSRIVGLTFGALLAPFVTTFLALFSRKLSSIFTTRHHAQTQYEDATHAVGHDLTSSSDSNDDDDDDKNPSLRGRKSSFFNTKKKSLKRLRNQTDIELNQQDPSATKRRKSSSADENVGTGYPTKTTAGVSNPHATVGAAIHSFANNNNASSSDNSSTAQVTTFNPSQYSPNSSIRPHVPQPHGRSSTRSRSLLDSQLWSASDIAEDMAIIPVTSEKLLGEDREASPPSQLSKLGLNSRPGSRGKRNSLISSQSANSISSDGAVWGSSMVGGSHRETSWNNLELPAPVVEDSYFKMPAVLETQGLERDVVRLPSPTPSRSTSAKNMGRSGSTDKAGGVFARVGSASKLVIRRSSSATASTSNCDALNFPAVNMERLADSRPRTLDGAVYVKLDENK